LNAGAQITILADSYRGKKLNSPNDVVYKSDGSLYFTDPPYGLRTQHDDDPEKQLQVNGVYRIPHALEQKAGAAPVRADLQLLVSDLTRPNGIAFSPDEKYLYVNNSEPKKLWMRYRVQPDGSLTEAKLLYDATSDPRPGSPDGMKIDEQGNIYSAGPGGVWIFSPEGDYSHARESRQSGLGRTRPQNALHRGEHQHLSRPAQDRRSTADKRALSGGQTAVPKGLRKRQ
jgi:gluconolactonase